MSATLPVARPSAWQPAVPALLLVAAVLWLLRDTAAAMVGIWARSDTFAHAFLVPPIALWLVWRRRAELAALPLRPLPWVLLPMAGASLMWLLGELAAVQAASQFALVTLLVLLVPALFGPAVTRVLAFPLLFLYFAVPVGEFLVPRFMEWTADFTVLALRATGVPVYREGLQFVIPSGTWSVVQACSGVRYLIASFMVGTLFAYLNFRSWRRRLIFVAFSIVVPIVANWLRAYMIVMIGHVSGNQLAVGVDHLIYGWVFFGVVIGAMFMIGARWSEAPAPTLAQAVPGLRASEGAPLRRTWWVATAAVALVAATLGWSSRLTHDGAAQPALVLPPELAAGWHAVPGGIAEWQPGFRNPSVRAAQLYQRENRRVWLWIGYYRHQGAERKLVSSVNGLVDLEDKGWSVLARRAVDVPGPQRSVRMFDAQLREAMPLALAAGQRLQVRQVYWMNGRYVAGDAEAKLRQAFTRLFGGPDDGAVLLMATDAGPDAQAVLDGFAHAQLEPLSERLQAVQARR